MIDSEDQTTVALRQFSASCVYVRPPHTGMSSSASDGIFFLPYIGLLS